jgi:hypothetical protein
MKAGTRNRQFSAWVEGAQQLDKTDTMTNKRPVEMEVTEQDKVRLFVELSVFSCLTWRAERRALL